MKIKQEMMEMSIVKVQVQDANLVPEIVWLHSIQMSLPGGIQVKTDGQMFEFKRPLKISHKSQE